MSRSISCLVLTVFSASILFVSSADGQEDLLQRAVSDQNRKIKGLVELRERIAKMSWLTDAKKVVDFLESKKEERKVDPFGMPMDPENPPEVTEVAPVVEQESVDQGPTAAETLAAALEKINVTGVFPSREEIIVGARSLRRGSTIVVSQGATNYRLQITGVTQNAVSFKDLNSGESAEAPLNIIPSGSFEGISRRPAPTDTEGGGTIVPRNADVYRVDADVESMATTGQSE